MTKQHSSTRMRACNSVAKQTCIRCRFTYGRSACCLVLCACILYELFHRQHCHGCACLRNPLRNPGQSGLQQPRPCPQQVVAT